MPFALTFLYIALDVYRIAKRDGYEHTSPEDMPRYAQRFFACGALAFVAFMALALLSLWYVVSWIVGVS